MIRTFDLEKPTAELFLEIMEYAEKNKKELDLKIILDDKSNKMKHMASLTPFTLSDNNRLAETIIKILTNVYRKSTDYVAEEEMKREMVIGLMKIFRKKGGYLPKISELELLTGIENANDKKIKELQNLLK